MCNLTLESLLSETQTPIGDVSLISQKRVGLRKLAIPRPMLSSDTIRVLRESYRITFARQGELDWLSMCIGAIQELERHIERLKKLERMLILKDQLLSGGTATEKKEMLSLMSSAEESTSSTCSDGWTGSPLLSKSREVVVPCTPCPSGSHPTSILMNGTTTLTQLPNKGKRLRED